MNRKLHRDYHHGLQIVGQSGQGALEQDRC